MKYYKTATATAHNNADTIATRDNYNNLVIDVSIFPDALKAAFLAKYHIQAYSTNFSYCKFYGNDGTEYHADFTIDRTAVYDARTGHRRYIIMTIKDYRIAGYTAADAYYNRKPSIYYEHGNIKNYYAIQDTEI